MSVYRLTSRHGHTREQYVRPLRRLCRVGDEVEMSAEIAAEWSRWGDEWVLVRGDSDGHAAAVVAGDEPAAAPLARRPRRNRKPKG